MNKSKLPPKIKRPVFCQFVRVQRCRYNPSYDAIQDLPKVTQWALWDKWAKKNFGIERPSLTVSKRVKKIKHLKLLKKRA